MTEDPARDGTNWYEYCRNNPLGAIDPTGLAPYINGVYDGPYDPDHKTPEVTYGPQWDSSSGSSSTSTNSNTSSQQKSEPEENHSPSEAELSSNRGTEFTIAVPVYSTLFNDINFDLGRDYSNLAVTNFQNGHPVLAGVQMLDAAAEAIIDIAAAYGAAEFVSAAVVAVPMLYGTLSSLSSGSTVVLGRYQGGACGGYTKMADKIGATCFQIPNTMYNVLDRVGAAEKINEAWLNGIVKSGARILLNSDPVAALQTDTAYGMEIRMLVESYEFKPVIEKGIECWEAVAK